jgi:hypothetical protein
MVDQPHPPDHSDMPDGERPRSGPGWLGRAILAALGLTALLNYLLGRRESVHLPVPGDHARPSDALFRPLPEEVVHGDGQIEHPNVSYERTDASLKWIGGLLLGTMGFAALVHWIILAFFYHYSHFEADIKRSEFPLVAGASNIEPPKPRLEQDDRMKDKIYPHNIPETDVMFIEATKLRWLNRWGNTEDTGFVHMPIAEAMALVGKDPTKYNAPYRKQLPSGMDKIEPWQRGLVDAGESNSGRMPRPEARWFEK